MDSSDGARQPFWTVVHSLSAHNERAGSLAELTFRSKIGGWQRTHLLYPPRLATNYQKIVWITREEDQPAWLQESVSATQEDREG